MGGFPYSITPKANVSCITVNMMRMYINTLRPRQNDRLSQTTFSNAFSWIKNLEFGLKFQWSLFLRAQLLIFQYWFRWWLGAGQATAHYLNQWWFRLPTYMCVTRPHWIKTKFSTVLLDYDKFKSIVIEDCNRMGVIYFVTMYTVNPRLT